MNQRTVDAPFRLPDALWERIEPELPVYKLSPKGGRPRVPWRCILDGIFYVLRTGCQWKAVPPEFGSGSTLHRYFQELVERGTFELIWAMALTEYDELRGIDWKWQSLDGSMTKAPLGGGKNRAESHGSGQAWHQAQFADRRLGHSHRCGGRRCQYA
jgi:transposase